MAGSALFPSHDLGTVLMLGAKKGIFKTAGDWETAGWATRLLPASLEKPAWHVCMEVCMAAAQGKMHHLLVLRDSGHGKKQLGLDCLYSTVVKRKQKRGRSILVHMAEINLRRQKPPVEQKGNSTPDLDFHYEYRPRKQDLTILLTIGVLEKIPQG